MRVFLFWDDKDFRGLPELMAALRSHSHPLSYWVGYTGGEHYCPSGTVFHPVSIRALADGYLLSTAAVSRKESIENYAKAILEAL